MIFFFKISSSLVNRKESKLQREPQFVISAPRLGVPAPQSWFLPIFSKKELTLVWTPKFDFLSFKAERDLKKDTLFKVYCTMKLFMAVPVVLQYNVLVHVIYRLRAEFPNGLYDDPFFPYQCKSEKIKNWFARSSTQELGLGAQ
jgi:hypothetical protein